jgi:alpha-glucosidase (family GH31 glycosyl hydrolase)
MKLKFTSIIISIISLFNSNPAQTYMGNYSSHISEGEVVSIFSDTSSIKLIFYDDDIVRLDFLPSSATIIDSSFIVIRDTSESVSYTINEFPNKLEVSTILLTISLNKNPLRLSVKNSSGEVILSEPVEGGIAYNGMERMVNFNLDYNDHFYGTGERGNDLDKRGLSFDSYNTQIVGYSAALETMNINVPFFVNKKGYGIYFDNTYPGRFDFGETNSNRFSYKVFGGEMSFYIIVTESIPKQLKKYTWLTGRQPLPPRWAFGYIQSKFGYRNESTARSMIQTMRQKGIPCDAIVLDLYWFNQMGDLFWNLASWPNPFQMMTDFLNDGIKTIVITEPYVVAAEKITKAIS